MEYGLSVDKCILRSQKLSLFLKRSVHFLPLLLEILDKPGQIRCSTDVHEDTSLMDLAVGADQYGLSVP